MRFIVPFKLVRDKIVGIINSQGGFCLSKELKLTAHRKALLAKLIEEAEELQRASTAEQQQEELADILETIITIQWAYGFLPQDLEALRKRKFALKGGFRRGIMLFLAIGGD